MKKTYLNKGGSYTALDGTETPHGKTITTEVDLIEKFGPTHFEEVRVMVVEVEAATAPVQAKKEVVQEPEKASDGMVDVTDEFPEAGLNSFIVKKDQKGWWVFDGDGEAANEKPLKKKEVEPFISEILAEG